jgi:hypothetical protein
MEKRHWANSEKSGDAYRGARRGIWIGAVIGAALAWLFARLLNLDVAAGGPGLHMMGGAAVGGLAGFLIGAMALRKGGEANYRGPERRVSTAAYPGRERRHTAGPSTA